MTPSPPNLVSTDRSRAFELIEQFGMLLFLTVLVGTCLLLVPNFAGVENLKGVLLQVSTVGIVACTMLFCLASGNFDLSVGTVIPCGGVVAAVVANTLHALPDYARAAAEAATRPGAGTLPALEHPTPFERFLIHVTPAALTTPIGCTLAAIFVAVAMGALVGLVNGLIVGGLKINPLITTLATMQIVKTLALDVSDSRSVGITVDELISIGWAKFLGLPAPVWIWLLCTAVFGFVLARTTFGRNTLAIGGNEEAARLAGVPVLRTKMVIFTVQGMLAAFTGVVVAAHTQIGTAKSSEGIELNIIAACVLGGVSLSGGIGRMTFVISGVLIMGVVENAMNLLHIDSRQQYAVRGFILLSAVVIDRLKPKR